MLSCMKTEGRQQCTPEVAWKGQSRHQSYEMNKMRQVLMLALVQEEKVV